MWLMLQQDQPADYVVASGRSLTVREMCDIAFRTAGLSASDHIVIKDRYFRPADVDSLLGNAAKAKAMLGWMPKISVEEMIGEMLEADLKRIQQRTV
jgi:GDPmannose 4,6-dehydratase